MSRPFIGSANAVEFMADVARRQAEQERRLTPNQEDLRPGSRQQSQVFGASNFSAIEVDKGDTETLLSVEFSRRPGGSPLTRWHFGVEVSVVGPLGTFADQVLNVHPVLWLTFDGPSTSFAGWSHGHNSVGFPSAGQYLHYDQMSAHFSGDRSTSGETVITDLRAQLVDTLYGVTVDSVEFSSARVFAFAFWDL